MSSKPPPPLFRVEPCDRCHAPIQQFTVDHQTIDFEGQYTPGILVSVCRYCDTRRVETDPQPWRFRDVS